MFKLLELLLLISLITITSCRKLECQSGKHRLPKEKIVNSPRPNNLRNLKE